MITENPLQTLNAVQADLKMVAEPAQANIRLLI